MKFHLYNEAGMHLNGRLTYTAAGDLIEVAHCVRQ